ncbi:MAG: alpha/beta hydrolase [Moorea sp. SIO3G5]|nr:alpha/beta hydrolase [Moorena sp. SIO3G5]
MVFIHGWLLSRSYWQPLIYRLSQQYQCLIYDLRGFGESQSQIHNTQSSTSNRDSESPFPQTAASSTDRYSLAAYAEDLGILLEKLGIEQAWLVGHSLGGSIALWGAYLLPQRIQGVICLNAGGGIYLKEEFERFRLAGEQLVKRRPRWLCYVPLLDLLFTRAQVARPIARKWGRQRVIDFVTANAEAALRTLLDSTTEAEVHRLPQVVSRLKQPVYFIAGTQDKVMEPKYVRHLASFHSLFQLCGDNVIEIAECGHMAMVEKPETIDDQIRQILANYS